MYGSGSPETTHKVASVKEPVGVATNEADVPVCVPAIDTTTLPFEFGVTPFTVLNDAVIVRPFISMPGPATKGTELAVEAVTAKAAWLAVPLRDPLNTPLNEPVKDPVLYDAVNELNDDVVTALAVNVLNELVVTNDPVSIEGTFVAYDAVKAYEALLAKLAVP